MVIMTPKQNIFHRFLTKKIIVAILSIYLLHEQLSCHKMQKLLFCLFCS